MRKFNELKEAEIEKLREFAVSHPKSICQCGHSGDGGNSFHGGQLGHGACEHAGCRCGKFTWKGWSQHFLAFRKWLDKQAKKAGKK